MDNLYTLDEALDYLNDKDKKDIQERGYTDSQYRYAKKYLKSFVDWENDKPINIMNMNNFELPSALFYCNISESQFIASFNKFATDKDIVTAKDFSINKYENSSLFKLFDENECYKIGDTIRTPYLLYFNKLKKFMMFYDDNQDSPNNLITYKELFKIGKESITKTNKSGSYANHHNQFAKAWETADKDLGYNRLK